MPDSNLEDNEIEGLLKAGQISDETAAQWRKFNGDVAAATEADSRAAADARMQSTPPGYWGDPQADSFVAQQQADRRAQETPAGYWGDPQADAAAQAQGQGARWPGESQGDYEARIAPVSSPQTVLASGPEPGPEPIRLVEPSGPALQPGRAVADMSPAVAGDSARTTVGNTMTDIVRNSAIGTLAGPAGVGLGAMSGILRTPDAEPPSSAQLVTGPSGRPPPTVPTPAQVATARPAGTGLGGAAGRIGAIGEEAVKSGKETQTALGEAYGAQKTAAERQAAIQSQAASDTAAAIDGQMRATAAYQKRLQDMAAGEEKASREAQAAYGEAQDDVKYAGISSDERKRLQATANSPDATLQQKASAKSQLDKAQSVDPEKYFGGMGGKITAGIAMALGAYGAAFTGGPNYAMQIIQQAIQDNIAAQKESFAKKRGEASEKRSLWDSVKDRFANDRQRETAAYGLSIDQVKQQLEKIKATSSSEEVLANADALGAQLDAEQTKTGAELDRQVRNDHLQAEMGRAGVLTNMAEINDRRAAAGAADGGKALTAEAANKLGDLQSAQAVVDDLSKAFDDKTSWGSFIKQWVPGTTEKQYEDQAGAASQVVGSILEGGKLSDYDKQFYRSLMPEPTDAADRKNNKIMILKTLLKQKLGGETQALRATGFAVPSAPEPQQQPSPRASETVTQR